jgi:hypothetical protein
MKLFRTIFLHYIQFVKIPRPHFNISQVNNRKAETNHAMPWRATMHWLLNRPYLKPIRRMQQEWTIKKIIQSDSRCIATRPCTVVYYSECLEVYPNFEPRSANSDPTATVDFT